LCAGLSDNFRHFGIGGPAGLSFSHNSKILYVGDAIGSGTLVEAFSFPDGTPLAGSPYSYTSGDNSNTVLLSKNGKCLFAANQFSSGVSAIPLTKGVPGTTATSFPAGTAGEPAGMANDTNGKIIYVASGFDNTVTAELIGKGCTLSEATGSPLATGAAAGSILLSIAAVP
jgi:DNA-binding beta-propeller fold protein YncE